MKLPTVRQQNDVIHRAAAATGWTDATALVDLACELMAQDMGGAAADYATVMRQAYDRDFRIWGAC